jgi:hypothetical protein
MVVNVVISCGREVVIKIGRTEESRNKGHLCLGDCSIDVDLADKLLHRCRRRHHLNADGEPAVVDDGKAALPWGACAERAHGESSDGGGHSDGSTDERVDGGIVSEDAEESLNPTTAWFSSAGLKGLESSEPVGRGSDDLGGRSSGEGRRGREESNEVVGDEAPVSVRDGELSWAGSSTVDDCGDMDIESSQALGSGVEEAVGRQDVDQSKLGVATNKGVFAGEGSSNSSHSSVGISAFLVLE